MKTCHVILGADLRGAHGSLEKQAGNNKIDLKRLSYGEAVVFINRAKDKVKTYAANGVVSYIRFDDKRRGIDLDALNEIPRAFSPTGHFDYTKALRLTLEKKLEAKSFKRTEAL
jgi:hypothetical protein